MKRMEMNWTVGYTASEEAPPADMFPASVPGAAQLDYANANSWPPYQFGINFERFSQPEDVFWVYQTTLDFLLKPAEAAYIIFHSIDYQYRVMMDDIVIAEGEGMFSPVVCDVTGYAGGPHTLKVLIYPAPKADDSQARSQARYSCKPASCYGWDWHPRLISVGMFDRVELVIRNMCHIDTMENSYQLSDGLDVCMLHTKLFITGDCTVRIRLFDGAVTAAEKTARCPAGQIDFDLAVQSPRVIAAIPQAEALEGMLASLGAKHTPEEIGIDRDELAVIFDHSPTVRNRLTLMRMRRMVKG